MPDLIEIKTGELFAGAGGLGLGFVLASHPQVRFRPVFAVDNDPHSINSYTRNMKWLAENTLELLPAVPVPLSEDAEKLVVRRILRSAKLKPGELGLLLGGPPCQGFSNSNRQHKERSKEERNRLVKIFFDRLSEIQPKMFLLENVQGVRWT